MSSIASLLRIVLKLDFGQSHQQYNEFGLAAGGAFSRQGRLHTTAPCEDMLPFG